MKTPGLRAALGQDGPTLALGEAPGSRGDLRLPALGRPAGPGPGGPPRFTEHQLPRPGSRGGAGGGAPAAKGRLAETGPEPEGFRDGVASGAAPPGTVHALVSWSLQADASTVRSPGSGDGGHGGPAGDSSS